MEINEKCFREYYEQLEFTMLSQQAVKSKETIGREKEEKPCAIRTEFQRDRDRILHSKAFRRLKHKTQVFIAPEGDHFRTRLTHTLEVSQIARTVARALQLNEDLTEAIALGHDLGHTPFGHAGEKALNKLYSKGFKHNEQSLRLVDKIEQGKGLNLTGEVRDGILTHTGEKKPKTLEGRIVRIADRIAYINHDIDDAVRGNILSVDELPKKSIALLGEKHNQRIDRMVSDLIKTSWSKSDICMSNAIATAMETLREYLFEHVYIDSLAKVEENKAMRLIEELYSYYMENVNEIPNEYRSNAIDCEEPAQAVIDYIAGMTDRYAIAVYQKLFVPVGFHHR